MKKNVKGITLIALVITIIVLLILASVSIAMLTGENGLLSKATDAKEKNIIGEEKEIIALAYSSLKINEVQKSEKITKDNLKTEIEKNNNEVTSENSDINGNVVESEESEYVKITYKDTTNWYIVNLETGKIEKYGANGEIVEDKITVGDTDIYDIEDLQEFQRLVNEGNTYKGYTVRLMDNIDLSSICGAEEGKGNWTPIGDYNTDNTLCFEGTFDGKNHTISNLYIKDDNLAAQGFFGNVRNGAIRNLTVEGSIKANKWAAGITARIHEAESQIIENCTNNVVVETTIGNGAAGIATVIDNSKNVTIKNCENNANIKSAGTSVGGIVGTIWDYEGTVNPDANIKISNCTNNEIITATTNNAGGIIGLVGYTTGVTIDNCKNTKEVKSTSSSAVGGIAGGICNNSNCSINNSSNTGAITATTYNAGGILGELTTNSIANIEYVYNEGIINVNTYDDAGGIVGIASDSSKIIIKYAYSKGNVYAKRYSSAGILGCSYSGSEATIENSFNEGTISVGSSNYGGIIGSISGTPASTAKISYCHNVGTISGSNSSKGAIVGYREDTYTGTANYWLSTCGATYGIGSTSANTNASSLTADKMKVQTNFSGWNFDTIWKMDETKGYPVLQWKK